MPFTIDPDRHPSARSGETHRITHGRASIMEEWLFPGGPKQGFRTPLLGPPGGAEIRAEKKPPPGFWGFFPS